MLFPNLTLKEFCQAHTPFFVSRGMELLDRFLKCIEMLIHKVVLGIRIQDMIIELEVLEEVEVRFG